MQIEKIKFATSVQVNLTEMMFVDRERDGCQMTLAPEHGIYTILDKKGRTILVHSTNVQWSMPRVTDAKASSVESEGGADRKVHKSLGKHQGRDI